MAKKLYRKSCGPSSCCPYPASGLGVGGYTADDLPDSVTANTAWFGGSLSKNVNGDGGYGGSGSTTLSVSSNNWVLTDGTNVFSHPCLFTGNTMLTGSDSSNTIQDQFNSTYTVSNANGYGSIYVADYNGVNCTPLNGVTLVRTGLCSWVSEYVGGDDIQAGPDPSAPTWTMTGVRLRAVLSGFTGGYWFWGFEGYGAVDVYAPGWTGPSHYPKWEFWYGGIKESPQNSPAGIYNNFAPAAGGCTIS